MKRYPILVLIVLHVLTILPSCQSASMSGSPPTTPVEIVYEVYVRSYCDGNSDGIGDLPGLISKLDYIHDLGATAIWLMPVHPSPSYHKYDVTDYYTIHPDYGTMTDMDRLIKEVHQRGMKIILDLVINHTSSEHPWFVASTSSPDDPHRQYYVWKDYEEVKDAIFKKSATFDSDNLTQWHEWPGDAERYYGFFWKGMPDLNFDHPPVLEEVYAIGKFWLDKGIDGFRLDAAKHIYPDDRFDDTRRFWEEFTTTMRTYNPEVKIIGEVWADPFMLAKLFKGLPSLFNFELSKAIPEAILMGDAGKFISVWESIRRTYNASAVPFEDALLLSNHDMNRIGSTLGGDPGKSKLAAALLLTLPGTPYIYYGEEIGMLGVKPDIHLREPFPWDENPLMNTRWEKPVYSVSPQVLSLADQMKDPASIYHHYKKWIAIRKENPVLHSGTLTFRDMQNNAVLSYTVGDDTTTCWVVHNLSDNEVSFPIMDPATNLVTGQAIQAHDVLEVPAQTSAIVRFGDK